MVVNLLTSLSLMLSHNVFGDGTFTVYIVIILPPGILSGGWCIITFHFVSIKLSLLCAYMNMYYWKVSHLGTYSSKQIHNNVNVYPKEIFFCCLIHYGRLYDIFGQKTYIEFKIDSNLRFSLYLIYEMNNIAY